MDSKDAASRGRCRPGDKVVPVDHRSIDNGNFIANRIQVLDSQSTSYVCEVCELEMYFITEE